MMFALFMMTPGCARDANSGWTPIESPQFMYKIKMPGTPQKLANGKEMDVWEVDEKRGTFSVMAEQKPKAVAGFTKEHFDFVRDGVLDKLKVKYGAEFVREADFSRNNRVIGREIEVRLVNVQKRARLVLASVNYVHWQLMVTGDPDWPGWQKADAFFDSFELLP